MRRFKPKGPTLKCCRGCHVKLPLLSLNARGFCSKQRCQEHCNRLMERAFAAAEPITIAPPVMPAPKALPPPNTETPSLRRLTPEQQRRLSSLARARMTTSEGLSPE